MAKKNSKRKTYAKRRALKILLKLLALGVFLLVLIPFIMFLLFMKDLPRPEKFAESIIPQSTKIYDREGEVLLYEISGAEKRTLIPLEEIPEYLQQAVVATEDKKFYQHNGIDLKAIGRALLQDLQLKAKSQGASTISQQLIRSYFLTQNKTIKRKTREIILSLEMERRYEKDQIMEWYLNLIPFGSNLYGVEAVSQSFFRKPTSKITLAESAVLTALIQAPGRLSPFGPNLEALHKRKDFVLDEMVDVGYITEIQAIAAKKEKVLFFEGSKKFLAPHFIMYLKAYLEDRYGVEYLERAGLTIITTIDIELQEKAEEIMKQGIEQAQGYNGHNGSLVSINPKTGELLVMVGSKDYFAESYPDGCNPGKDCLFDPQVNVSTSLRQPGSSFKPLVYALALFQGYTPDMHVWDVKTEFNRFCSPTGTQTKDKYNQDCYHPRNYDGMYRGQIDLKSALAQSRNLPAVKVLYLTGLKQALDFAQKLGISTLREEQNYGLSLVLGGGEVKLLDMTRAYSVFANDGVRTPLNIIRKITDSKGNIIESMREDTLRVMPTQTARQINDILSDNSARAPLFGWNSQLYLPEYNAAVKTGTTQEYKDAWTMGYTSSLATGVWVGNNDNTPTYKAGVYLAAPIWNRFMNEALPKFQHQNFTPPRGETTNKSVLDGAFLGNHSILYYLNKKDPRGSGTSFSDVQTPNWEYGVQSWLGQH